MFQHNDLREGEDDSVRMVVTCRRCVRALRKGAKKFDESNVLTVVEGSEI